MAKKQTKVSAQADPGDEHVEQVVIKTPPVMEKPLPKKNKNTWEIKDRLYYLKGDKKPLSRMIKSADLYWFDEEKGYEREIKYCENQTTPFVDEMKGDQRLSHIIFRSGNLYVPKEKSILQKFLSLYHPDRDVIFYEDKPVERAEDHLDWLEFEIDAMNAANNLDIDMMEAIMRVEIGSSVSALSSKELKRDLLLFAKKKPKLFLELVTDDNIGLRNMAVKACESHIIELSQDQRTFSWKSTGRKLMSVPFDENPYSALAAWFKTDEGVEVYSQVEKRLK
tara:strand:- start:14207 stop:15046 length:840 start_codon:yes stop_codon:yes gene_type:complete